MKKLFSTYSITLLALIILSFIFSIIIGTLYNLQILNTKGYYLAVNITAIVVFLSLGVFIGLKVKNGGLIYGGIFGIIYLLITVLIHYGILKESFEFIDFITIFLRSILLPIGSIIGVNLRK